MKALCGHRAESFFYRFTSLFSLKQGLFRCERIRFFPMFYFWAKNGKEPCQGKFSYYLIKGSTAGPICSYSVVCRCRVANSRRRRLSKNRWYPYSDSLTRLNGVWVLLRMPSPCEKKKKSCNFTTAENKLLIDLLLKNYEKYYDSDCYWLKY